MKIMKHPQITFGVLRSHRRKTHRRNTPLSKTLLLTLLCLLSLPAMPQIARQAKNGKIGRAHV